MTPDNSSFEYFMRALPFAPAPAGSLFLLLFVRESETLNLKPADKQKGL